MIIIIIAPAPLLLLHKVVVVSKYVFVSLIAEMPIVNVTLLSH
jgi:hypothetical protein